MSSKNRWLGRGGLDSLPPSTIFCDRFLALPSAHTSKATKLQADIRKWIAVEEDAQQCPHSDSRIVVAKVVQGAYRHDDALAARWVALAALGDDWDGAGAPAPSDLAMSSAKSLAKALMSAGLDVDEVDADAIGGVAIWVGNDTRDVRFAVRNSGRVLLVLRDGVNTSVRSIENFAPGIAATKAFLAGLLH